MKINHSAEHHAASILVYLGIVRTALNDERWTALVEEVRQMHRDGADAVIALARMYAEDEAATADAKARLEGLIKQATSDYGSQK
jgi:hypothetical protein